MKILFLDIDGVLNSRAYDRKRNWSELTNIDETRLPLVKKIIDKTGAKIVLISTWRRHWDKDESLCDEDGMYINRLFTKYGLTIYDKTPDLDLLSKRRDEVKAWLEDKAWLVEYGYEVECFVILDDYRFGWEDLSEFCIHTNPQYGLGLEEEHVASAINLLNSSKW